MTDVDEAEIKSAPDPVETLVAEVMKVERRFGHALRGAKSDRLEGIRQAIENSSKAAQ